MKCTKFKLETSGKAEDTLVIVDDVILGCIQDLDIKISAVPSAGVVIKLKRWVKKSSPAAITNVQDLKDSLKSVFGVYSTSFIADEWEEKEEVIEFE